MTMMNLLTYYLPLASDYSSLLAIRSHAARSVSSERYSSCFHSWSGLSFVHTSFLITILAVIPVLHSYAYGVRSPRLCPSLFRVSSVLTSDKNKVKMFLFQFTIRVLLTHCFSYFYYISFLLQCDASTILTVVDVGLLQIHLWLSLAWWCWAIVCFLRHENTHKLDGAVRCCTVRSDAVINHAHIS